MLVKEEEKTKVNSSEIKLLEKRLDLIEKEESILLDEFDLNVEEILGSDLLAKLKRISKLDSDNRTSSLLGRCKPKEIRVSFGRKVEVPFSNILNEIHKSEIDDPGIRKEFENRVSSWFKKKTSELQESLNGQEFNKKFDSNMARAFALASLGLTVFHSKPNMHLHEVQKLTSIAVYEGNVAELGTGEGKTLSAVLPVYMHALRGKGAHVITANSYLSKRDFDEVRPIFEGLGLTIGYVPDSIDDLAIIEGVDLKTAPFEDVKRLEKKFLLMKKEAYARDVTYGSKAAFAFDYLKDSIASSIDDVMGRESKPGYALIDEVDDALIDDGHSPYVLGGNLPVFQDGMNLRDLQTVLNIPLADIKEKLRENGDYTGDLTPLSYERARYIASSLFNKELVPDIYLYERQAQKFLNREVLRIKDRLYEIGKEEFIVGRKKLSNSDIFEILSEGVDYYNGERFDEIQRNSYVIYNPEKGEYFIKPSCYDAFLKNCYIAFQMKSIAQSNKDKILSDPNYVSGVDYNVANGNILLTLEGAEKLIIDPHHKEFSEDYKKYMSYIYPLSSTITHCLDEAVRANILLKSPEDYVVVDGKVKVVKNSRIKEDSTYSDGLQQAIEIKEGLTRRNITRENETVASITQKDFYSRYDLFAGMTGTSAKSIFREIFGKQTVQIPRNVFYKYYSKRLKRKGTSSREEPVGVEKKDVVFSANEQKKIELMINSIIESISKRQPVLLVVSNPSEMKAIHEALLQRNIKHNLLSATTDKDKEANIIAKAGLPGAVTVSTEMAGRGTDIKVGGDRDTLIDIATNRYIKQLEKKNGSPLSLTSEAREFLRKKVEQSLMDYNKGQLLSKRLLWSKEEEEANRKLLESEGLKVISSGFFKIDRIDKQLEGRTGRNGKKGVCERFVAPSDLEYIGLFSFNNKKSVSELFANAKIDEQGRLILSTKEYRLINDKVREKQSANEYEIKESIRNAQELSRSSATLVEKYRDDRRRILSNDIDVDLRIESLIEDTVDSMVLAYTNEKVSRDNIVSRLASGDLTLDFDSLALEVKEYLGVDIDVQSLKKSDVNLLEFRNALLNLALDIHDKRKKDNPLEQAKKDVNALLVANSYMISNVPNALNSALTKKNLTALSMGMESQVDYAGTMEFSTTVRRMQLEASKEGIRNLMGVMLTKEEQNDLERRKEERFGASLGQVEEKNGYSYQESSLEENNRQALDNFRRLKSPIEEKASQKKIKADKKAQKLIEKKGTIEEISRVYSNLKIRPMKFIESLSNLNARGRLVLKMEIPNLEKKETSGLNK